MYIPRKLEDTIIKYLDAPEILAIVGPRQSGKTTLLRQMFEKVKENAVFLTFEDNKILNLFVHNVDEFTSKYVKPYKYVFIDEFHYARKGGKILKYIIDTSPKKILLSGSSSIDLTIQAVKYLVGRVFIFSLFPFDFEEFLTCRNPQMLEVYKAKRVDLKRLEKDPLPLNTAEVGALRQCYHEYALYGGYPRVVTSADFEEKKIVLKNIYNTYFLREVKDILGLVDDYKMAQMIKALALQIGGLVEYHEIGKVSELSYQTVKGYLNFLKKTFICSLIKPYFKNKRTEIVKNPKVYFFDNGLRNYVINDFRGLGQRPDCGALLENTLAMQFTKQEISFKFWRSKKQAEVDFILELPDNQRLALEVKSKAALSDIRSKSVKEFKHYHPDIPLRFCSYLDPVDNIRTDNFFLALL